MNLVLNGTWYFWCHVVPLVSYQKYYADHPDRPDNSYMFTPNLPVNHADLF